MPYKTNEVAKIVGVTKTTLYTWLRQGKIPKPRRDYNYYRIWSEADLKAILEFRHRTYEPEEI